MYMSKKSLNYYTDIEKFYHENRDEMNDLFEEFLNICEKNDIDMNYDDETSVNSYILFSPMQTLLFFILIIY